MIGNASVILLLWLLLTGDVRPPNLLLGVICGAIFGRLFGQNIPLDAYVRFAALTLLVLLRGFVESIWMIVVPHAHADVTVEQPRQTDTLFDRFAAVFHCTLTPKTLALDLDETKQMHVHRVNYRPPGGAS